MADGSCVVQDKHKCLFAEICEKADSHEPMYVPCTIAILDSRKSCMKLQLSRVRPDKNARGGIPGSREGPKVNGRRERTLDATLRGRKKRCRGMRLETGVCNNSKSLNWQVLPGIGRMRDSVICKLRLTKHLQSLPDKVQRFGFLGTVTKISN